MTVLTRAVLSPIIALMAAVPPVAASEPEPPAYTVPNSRVLTVHSERGARDYQLYVRLPIGYERSGARYPVLYLLDAEYSFPIASAIVQHLEERNNLEEIILVGIAYPKKDRENYRYNRTRDYTPTHTLRGGYGEEYQRNSGGAPAFLGIIRDEIIPHVDRHFRTRPGERGIVGHSYGGLFATYALLADPTVFSRYIVVSPSYWYDGKAIFRLEEAQAKQRSDLAADVFIAIGSWENQPQNGRSMVDDAEEFARRLKARNYKSVAVQVRVLPDETHNTVFPNALSRGLRAHYWRTPGGG